MTNLTERQTLVCCECGKTETLDWDDQTNAELLAGPWCFMCAFWAEKIGWAQTGRTGDGRSVARINGTHYVLSGIVGGPAKYRGNYGRTYTVRFTDGHTETTDSLWDQGAIPEQFRDRLPDNAEFVGEGLAP